MKILDKIIDRPSQIEESLKGCHEGVVYVRYDDYAALFIPGCSSSVVDPSIYSLEICHRFTVGQEGLSLTGYDDLYDAAVSAKSNPRVIQVYYYPTMKDFLITNLWSEI
jgi:hypothetical protein